MSAKKCSRLLSKASSAGVRISDSGGMFDEVAD